MRQFFKTGRGLPIGQSDSLPSIQKRSRLLLPLGRNRSDVRNSEGSYSPHGRSLFALSSGSVHHFINDSLSFHQGNIRESIGKHKGNDREYPNKSRKEGEGGASTIQGDSTLVLPLYYICSTSRPKFYHRAFIQSLPGSDCRTEPRRTAVGAPSEKSRTWLGLGRYLAWASFAISSVFLCLSVGYSLLIYGLFHWLSFGSTTKEQATKKHSNVFSEASNVTPDGFETKLSFVRVLFGSSSSAVRRYVEAQSNKRRRIAEAVSNLSRRSLEAVSKSSRRTVEESVSNFGSFVEEVKNTRFFKGPRTKVELALTQAKTKDELGMNYQRTRDELAGIHKRSKSFIILRNHSQYVKASAIPLDRLRTVYAKQRQIKSTCLKHETYNHDTCPTHVQHMNDTSNTHVRHMNDTSKRVDLHPRKGTEMYQKGTGKVLKLGGKGTGEVLERYQIGAKKLQTGSSSAEVSDRDKDCFARHCDRNEMERSNLLGKQHRQDVALRSNAKILEDLRTTRLILQAFRERCKEFRCKVESMLIDEKIKAQNGLKSVALKIFILPMIFCVLFSGLLDSPAFGQEATGLKQALLRGEVRSASDHSTIEGATVSIGKKTVYTDANGDFSIAVDKSLGVLKIKHIGYKEQSVAYDNTTTFLTVELESTAQEIQEVDVVSTGYQKIPKERATGSFEFVNNETLNQTISGNIIDRIELQVPGLLVDKNEGAPDKFLIRGRSSIFADVQPLIVLDGFPYDGEIGNINPNDIESVTVLKDAAAASIWGARAGNGVIVITTKQGKTKKPTISLNAIFGLSQKPSYSNVSQVSSEDYIELEKWLFEKDHYTGDEFFDSMNNGHPPFTPVIELLRKQRDNVLTADEVERQIELLKNYDVRKDILRDLYQLGFKQQYGVQIGQQTDRSRYIFSAGYDHNRNLLVGQGDKRLNLRVNLETEILKNIWLNNSLNYTNSSQFNGINGGFSVRGFAPFATGGGKGLYPYAQLRNKDGSPAYLYLDNNEAYVASQMANGLDWSYSPIDDINKIRSSNDVGDLLLNTGIKFNPIANLNLSFQYQFEDQNSLMSSIYTAESYYARAYTNSFAQLGTNGKFTFPVPQGGMWDTNTGRRRVHQGRVQGDYSKMWSSGHDLNLMAGWEIRSNVNKTSADKLYGYSEEFYGINPIVDYMTEYVLYNNSFMRQRIPAGKGIGKFTDNFLSMFFNSSYSFKNRYIATFSIRKDEANLFGVNTNQKGTPLWSSGLRWKVSDESFYKIDWLPTVSLRATYGKSGNISRNASALPVIQLANSAYTTPLPTASLMKMPNPDLRWEKVNIFNIGLDFATVGNKLSGSLEYFDKHSEDIMGQAPIDPTLGRGLFWGNIGEMHAKGFDLRLNAKLLDRTWKWNTTLIMGYSNPKVTKYFMPVSTKGNTYLVRVGNTIDPIVDKPVFGMYSFPWIGLDPTDGSPQGMLNGELSKDFNNIYANTPLDDMLYHGSAQPTVYGSLNNAINYKNLELRIMLSYKGGYSFRRSSLSYATLFSSWNGHGEYAHRWQQAGDEKITDVPSMVYPHNSSRDRLYNYAEINVLRGDHIRLENIRLNYAVPTIPVFGNAIKQVNAFLFVQNIPLVWLRNKDGIDPYYNESLRKGIQWSLGLNFSL